MQTSTKYKYLTLIMVTFIAACIETDIYLPSFPDMMEFFHTSEATIQSLLSWNFVGICFSGPFYGPLSDSFGRKKLLMLALTLFLIGSIGTLVSADITTMLLWRLLQGLGSGGCFTLGTTIIFDKFKAEEAIKAINDINCIIPVIMAGAPMVGGYLNIHYGFRSNFLFVAIFVILSFLICLFFLDETLPREQRLPWEFKQVLANFGKAMRCWTFWQPTILVSVIFAAYLSYISYSSLLFVNHLGVSRELFPYYQGSILIAFVVATLSANKILTRFGIDKSMRWGMWLTCIGVICFLISASLRPQQYQLFHATMMVFAFGAGWLVGPYFTQAMEALPDIKGITASLVTSFRLLFTAGVIAITSNAFEGSVMPLVYVNSGLLVLGAVIHTIGNKEQSSDAV